MAGTTSTSAVGETRAPWQHQLAEAVGRLHELLGLLGLEAEQVGVSREAAAAFPLRVPRGFVARMRPGDPRDPLLRQVLPVEAEVAPAAGFVADPLAERWASPSPALLEKFHGRALVIATGACAVHCRYCFRRHFPYEDHPARGDAWAAALDHLRADPDLREVILSGGDPLVLSDRRLAAMAGDLATIPHLERLRVHTRLPIVLPERVDDALLGWLRATRLQGVVVVHANHANEIDDEVAAALGRLRGAGAVVLNQAVLLRGVNDDVEAQVALAETLFRAGVLPYYLHALDPVAGAAHFAVDDDEARAMMREVAARLPGYLVPRLVREVPGGDAKMPLDLIARAAR